MENNRMDAVVVGAGASGGIVAKELAEAGWRVVVLERGPWLESFGRPATQAAAFATGSRQPRGRGAPSCRQAPRMETVSHAARDSFTALPWTSRLRSLRLLQRIWMRGGREIFHARDRHSPSHQDRALPCNSAGLRPGDHGGWTRHAGRCTVRAVGL